MKNNLPDVFKIGDAVYRVDRLGVIHQQPPFEVKRYDVQYVAERYDDKPALVTAMSHLRAGWLLGVCSRLSHVLDVGYGNGGFLRAMRAAGLHCAGTDISGYPVPEGCASLTWAEAVAESWSLVTFFDSLEHFPDLEVLAELKARYVCVTVPSVAEHATVSWLAEWKHLRPGEHLHHFTPTALDLLLRTHGYRQVRAQPLEDMIRRTAIADSTPNTCTSLYECL